MDRMEHIKSMIPENVESVLDLGCNDCYLRGFFPKYVGIDMNEKCDVKQDLLKDSKLKFPDKSFDIVILSQIIEHLVFFEELIKESKRVARNYILVGLPNEFTYDQRLRYLFLKMDLKFDYPYNHKYFFDIKLIQKFTQRYFGRYEKRWFLFGSMGGRFMPFKLRNFLANLYPSLFSKEVYYLIKKSPETEIQ